MVAQQKHSHVQVWVAQNELQQELFAHDYDD